MIKTPNILKVFSQLYYRYNKLGFEIYGSYSPLLSVNWPSNYVVKGNKLTCTSGGLANDEMFIMYPLLITLKPKNILIIGNGYGISTLFISLSLEKAKVVALDKYRTKGISITKKLLRGLKNKHIIKASTPDDLEKIIKKYFNNKLDMVFVDAVHTNEVQTKEFSIYEKYLTNNSIVFFHDVIACNLFKSYFYLKKKYKNYSFKFLNKSSNGIAVCLRKKSYKKIEKFLKFFSTEKSKTSSFIKYINFVNRGHQYTEKYFINSKKNKKKFYTPKHPQL